MSATDELLDTGYPHSLRPELHKALKARGIDYWVAQGITFWNRDDGCECLAYGYQADGVPKLAVKVVGFTTPEQAIDAIVGRGMCHIKEVASYGYPFECGECKAWYGADFLRGELRFCPNCGAEVVDE